MNKIRIKSDKNNDKQIELVSFIQKIKIKITERWYWVI